ncbi:MAG: ABC transporter permease subunit [Crocinitomicaceae bacterium]
MIWTIFKKELIDTIRDRRTMMTMLVIPMLMFPIILSIFVSISSYFEETAANKSIRIGIISNSKIFTSQFSSIPPEIMGKHELVFYSDSLSLRKGINDKQVDIAFCTSSTYDENMVSKKPAKLNVFYDVTEVGMDERAKVISEVLVKNAQIKRLSELKINSKDITPVETDYINTASPQQMIGEFGGAILPYLFIAFGFIGCMYPAIDLFTGEKERGTIETLLTTPVKRWKLLIGKMLVVILSGLMASTFALIGLWVSIEFLDIVKDQQILAIIHDILNPKFLFSMFGLLIPLTVFFAGVMVPIAIYAKSFKEAQSIITPLNIVMVLPAMIGFFPGISLDFTTASIPVVNVVLASKELIAGTLDWSYYLVSFIVMFIIASLAVLISFRQFGKEGSVIA